MLCRKRTNGISVAADKCRDVSFYVFYLFIFLVFHAFFVIYDFGFFYPRTLDPTHIFNGQNPEYRVVGVKSTDDVTDDDDDMLLLPQHPNTGK